MLNDCHIIILYRTCTVYRYITAIQVHQTHPEFRSLLTAVMGRRALSLGAVGVVATMMIHSPADSFLGSSVRFPLVLPGKNGSSSSSRSSTACLKCIGGNWSSASRGDSARPRQGMRLRRPARWRLSCSMRGGYEGEGETAGRKGEAEMKRSVGWSLKLGRWAVLMVH